MTQKHDKEEVPNLGEFVVEGFVQKVSIESKSGLKGSEVISVRRGWNTYTVYLNSLEATSPSAMLPFLEPGDKITIQGIMLGDIILTSIGRVQKIAPPPTRPSAQDYLRH